MLIRFNKRGDGVSIAIDVPAVPRIGEYVSVDRAPVSIEGDVYEVAHLITEDGTEVRVILK